MYWFSIQSTLDTNENTHGPEVEKYGTLYHFRQSIPTNWKHFTKNFASGKK